MTEEKEKEALVEAPTTAWRPRAIDGTLRAHPAWHDLDESGRVEAHEATRRVRALEAQLDPEGLTSTAKAVLARIRQHRIE
jgi:hypothetical protein